MQVSRVAVPLTAGRPRELSVARGRTSSVAGVAGLLPSLSLPPLPLFPLPFGSSLSFALPLDLHGDLQIQGFKETHPPIERMDTTCPPGRWPGAEPAVRSAGR